MKVQVKDIEDKPKEKIFHPFVLEFKIEDESDLEDLAVRFNIFCGKVTTEGGYNGYKAKSQSDVWDFVDYLLRTKPYMK